MTDLPAPSVALRSCLTAQCSVSTVTTAPLSSHPELAPPSEEEISGSTAVGQHTVRWPT